MSKKVFLSYRRSDSAGSTGRLADLIAADERFDLLIDIDTIEIGLDYREAIVEQIEGCDVVLAVIGSGWLDAQTATGERRLDDPRDPVRLEIETALKVGKRIVPILVDDATVPPDEFLPESLAPLSTRNGVEVRHESFKRDADRLLDAIGALGSSPSGSRRPSPNSPTGSNHVPEALSRVSAGTGNAVREVETAVKRVANVTRSEVRARSSRDPHEPTTADQGKPARRFVLPGLIGLLVLALLAASVPGVGTRIAGVIISIALFGACGAVSRHVAIKKGRNPTLWLILGIVFSIYALIVIAVLPRAKPAISGD